MTECLSQDDAFFAIIADEVTDVHANQEVLSVCLRFLDNLNPEQPEVKEVFFDFVYLDKTDHCIDIVQSASQLYKSTVSFDMYSQQFILCYCLGKGLLLRIRY